MAAARGLAGACGFACLLAAAAAPAETAAIESAPPALEEACEPANLHEARADVRMKAGLPETDLVPVELTAEQQRALTGGFEALVAKCPQDPEMRYRLYKVLAGDKATPGDRLIAAAEEVSAAHAARPGKYPMPAQALVAQDLLERHLAPQLAGRLLDEGRKDFTAFRQQVAKDPQTADPEELRQLNTYLDGNAAYLDVVEARLRLEQGDAAAAGQKLAAAHATLIAGGPVAPSRAAIQYDLVRRALVAAAPGLAAPPELQLAAMPEGAANEGFFKNAEFAFEGLPLDDVAGKSFTIKDLEGKTWLVNLWATWCGPCMAELPHIQKLYDELKGRADVGLLTLNFDSDLKRVKPFLDRRSYTFPVLMTAGKLDRFVKQGIPQNWVVDRGGTIRRIATGFDTGHPDAFLEQVKHELEKLKTP